ncbi:hypothetical protein C8R47DRAFT_1083685 [Mycena vitilis]|nr:hypothetical protein C8R47DRAFT_1083685 [Mycena vitilis]
MSIFLEGSSGLSVGFSDEATTMVSLSAARRLRIPRDKRSLLTTMVPWLSDYIYASDTGAVAIASAATDISSPDFLTAPSRASVYPNRQSMVFAALSSVLSASDDRLSDDHLHVVCATLGLAFSSRHTALNDIGRRHLGLISQHSASNPVLALFEQLDKLSKGSLVSVAQSHGINPSGKRETLRSAIFKHVGTGLCYKDEAQQSHLACASTTSQLTTDYHDEWDHTNPSVRVQIQILKQLSPILKVPSLRRLLGLHDISYVESDKIKVLRKRLKKIIYALHTGKPTTEYGTGTRRAQHALTEARLRENWPQVIPTHLKERLLANFNFEISAKALSTFRGHGIGKTVVSNCIARRVID